MQILSITVTQKISNSTSAKEQAAQAEQMQDAISNIIKTSLDNSSDSASSSSRENELQQEIERLSQENKQIKNALNKVYSFAKRLEAKQKELQETISKQEEVIREQAQLLADAQAKKPAAQTNSQSNAKSRAAVATQPSSAKIADEEKAEKWARNNKHKWLDSSCRAGRTWRELATNVGDMVSIRGRLQKPRSHLHIIMKTDKSPWNRMKAKVALEMFPSENQVSNNHYVHSLEAGGAM